MKKSLLAFLIAAAPLFVFAQLPSYLPTDGLVGWWPFNGNANDESGNGNDGTVNAASLVTDRCGNFNSAYSFDGSTNYIQCQNAGPTGNPVITFTCWIKTASTNYGNIISYGGNSESGQDFRVFINGNCPNSIAFDTYDNQKSKVNSYINSWDFYCVLYDGGIGNNTTASSFYKNGILMTTECFNVNISSTNISNLIPITFGKYHGTLPANPTGFYEGILDDIGIWNRALTEQEITALYISDPSGSGSGNTATNNVPAAISYQAIARNAQGQPLSDAAVQVKFTLLTDSLTGAAEYSESHSLTTNSLGLFTTAFGAGTPETGTFANINWASGGKYLKVELDAGDGFVDMGTQQLLSVPYSMRSNTSSKAGTIENAGLPVYADNVAALAGGLVAGQMYRTATGDLKIVY